MLSTICLVPGTLSRLCSKGGGDFAQSLKTMSLFALRESFQAFQALDTSFELWQDDLTCAKVIRPLHL